MMGEDEDVNSIICHITHVLEGLPVHNCIKSQQLVITPSLRGSGFIKGHSYILVYKCVNIGFRNTPTSFSFLQENIPK